MVDLISGRSKVCKDSLGGLSKCYLFPFVNYSYSQIEVSGNILTSFPDTDIYPFEFDNNPTLSLSQNENEGGKYFEERIELGFTKPNSYNEFQKLLKKDYRMIIKDRLGNYRLLGAYNGLIGDNLKLSTGGAHADFNGYNITFEGQEENEALYINNLEDAGFTIIENNFILLENGEFMLTEDNQLIYVEE